MSTLPLAVALHLAASCAPAVAPETWLSVARTESRFDPLAIGDNTTGRSYAPATLAVAVALASSLVAAGHSLDLGVAQINTGEVRDTCEKWSPARPGRFEAGPKITRVDLGRDAEAAWRAQSAGLGLSRTA